MRGYRLGVSWYRIWRERSLLCVVPDRAGLGAGPGRRGCCGRGRLGHVSERGRVGRLPVRRRYVHRPGRKLRGSGLPGLRGSAGCSLVAGAHGRCLCHSLCNIGHGDTRPSRRPSAGLRPSAGGHRNQRLAARPPVCRATSNRGAAKALAARRPGLPGTAVARWTDRSSSAPSPRAQASRAKPSLKPYSKARAVKPHRSTRNRRRRRRRSVNSSMKWECSPIATTRADPMMPRSGSRSSSGASGSRWVSGTACSRSLSVNETRGMNGAC